MSSALSHSSSRSIATRVMYGTAVVALLAFIIGVYPQPLLELVQQAGSAAQELG